MRNFDNDESAMLFLCIMLEAAATKWIMAHFSAALCGAARAFGTYQTSTADDSGASSISSMPPVTGTIFFFLG